MTANFTLSSKHSWSMEARSVASARRASVMAAAFLEQTEKPSESEVREALAGNLCRCTGYQKIVDSVVRTVMNGDESC